MANKRESARGDTGSLSTTSQRAPLALPADCRIAASPALKDALLGRLDEGTITLDGSQVERADTAALQLLLLFRRELAMRGGNLSWLGASAALLEAADLLGLTHTLELPTVASA